jgi:hypothetical protein
MAESKILRPLSLRKAPPYYLAFHLEQLGLYGQIRTYEGGRHCGDLVPECPISQRLISTD